MRCRTALATFALAAFALPAHAADMGPAPIEPLDFGAPEFRGAIHDWTAAYVGVHGGWGWGSHTARLTDIAGFTLIPAPTDSVDIDNALFGVQMGYDGQLDALIWGIEADFSWINQGVRESLVPLDFRADMDWLASGRLKLGYGWENLMLYATGGVALTQLDVSESFLGIEYDDYLVGWVAGAGVEYAFSPAWSVRGEWLYYDFGTSGHRTEALPGVEVGFNTEHDFHTVRAALNYRFAP